MKKYLLSNVGSFYKANLHVHTNVSDGAMSPEEIKRIYMEKGYSVVAFTDHEVMVPHPELTDENFVAITSTEISTNNRTDCDFCYAKTYHLNIYSPDENKNCFNTFDKSKMWLEHSYQNITGEQEATQHNRIYDVNDVNKVIKMANDEGCIVSYNHPVWSLQNYSDYADLKGLWGIELYNTGCARNGYFDTAQPFDDLLRQGKNVFPLATDDAHLLRDCFGGYVMIRAEGLTYGSIFNALKNGDFYASTGPEFLEISIENGVVKIVTSPVAFVGLSTENRHLFAKREEANSLTEVSFDIGWHIDMLKQGISENPYIRITLVDEKGNTAYSRAYFVNEFIDD
ncbi:MAG: PHP domain-containing protein [Clostridia bacterium]|nr:PHP domain-containing protein [Clostridia bacterium]